MNSQQITQILLQNPYTKSYFKGCYPSDQIPLQITQFPYFIIVNTKPSTHQGEHWQFIWVESAKRAQFFDSFGSKPQGQIAAYLQKFTKLTTNDEPIQRTWSQACGIYVILYAIAKCRREAHAKIIKNLLQISPFTIEQMLR